MNKNVIIALIIIVLIAVVGIFVFSSGAKADTQINFLSGSNLQSGGEVQFELKDTQGNALAGQNVNISIKSDEQTKNYSIVTDSEGKGGVILDNGEYGNYNVTVSYGGDDKHNGCSANQTISIGEYTSETSEDTSTSDSGSSQSSSNSSSSSSSSSQSSSKDLNYDSELNVYYDSNGKIVGGQNDGASYDYIKNNPPKVENGSLV